ncbi:oxaloacetate decarboxylase subunit alpha [Acetivibrio saccincola]|jgi:oxaloacetate decarboxylase alpha subunit|uniref:Methylmalonyl-CoA carboxyltransferase 5S subunit n=1 Tax=Acetivibrio saccincola TaxID=1677857 RepID=A0A2K9EBM0_9FIRM|nr:oxaloacetate decarboxylase subunit alpha [Acetivibrio saccincola]AUG57564.1 Methylmalonyl-CoA carboxyltransferase 5S subunit [Acetivibrio saccincola]NLW26855.1 oxaloacetate decarboxylase subunit alpha [Acetivibrio saccincola]PQQ67475.1 oxaloacetate decarboxylase [Acetivibrio saccincola]HQD28746.1 oxaloacetate decarboxylase subunit alpha [Acetivibrio saccincola]
MAKITETVLRDAHQSLIATRMKIDEMAPILEKLDDIGYHSLEAWGGATFDSCLRFLNEDPWERLRTIRKHVKKTKLQMLLRGQNLLGYKHYADDVVEYFVQKAIANGIDIIRIFDALNDVRNIETAIKACKKEGGHAQAAVCYTTSPVHNLDLFVKDAKRLVDMGADSICIKDMAGLMLPYAAYDLVKALKENVKVPIQIHTHYTSGVASMTYLKAIEAGCDVVDCAISPLALGTSQPPTESVVATLKGTEYDTGLDINKLNEIAEYFKPLREEYLNSGLLDAKVLGVDINTLIYQVPGGMLSNLVSQLKQSNALDKFEEVLKEIPKVREDFGFPPLVTPTSQIVGTQAVLNVLMGERYKMVPKESKALVKGEYGKTPAPVNPEIQKKILNGEKPITKRPADFIKPELKNIKNEMKEYLEQDEDVLSYALFPSVAKKYFEFRKAEKYGIDPDMVDYENRVHPV